MDQIDETLAHHATPEMREAVRAQILLARFQTSHDIAIALGLRHGTIVRILERFEAVGALRVVPTHEDTVTIAPDSLSARFQDLTIPLW